MCPFFWLQTIPARSTIPLYSRLVEAYIVQALAGVLRFVRVEPDSSPRALAIRLPLLPTRAAKRARRAAFETCNCCNKKGLCRAAGQGHVVLR